MKIIYLFAFFLPNLVIAEGEPWRRIDSMVIANDSLGLSITEGDYIQDKRGPYYYDLDTKSWVMRPIDEMQFKSKFGANLLPPRKLSLKERELKEIHTSKGDILRVKYSGCKVQDEGGPECSGNNISLGDKHFSLDHGNVTVLLAEKFSSQLWLALGDSGEYEMYGEGVYVYDINLNKKVFFYDEHVMDGLLVSTIVRNDVSGETWLGTSKGLRIVDSTLKNTRPYYFYEDFDSKTGVPQLEISDKPQEDDWLARIARRFEVSDAKSFRTTVSSLSPIGIDALKVINEYSNTFFPDELNVLLPYFLSATKSKTHSIKNNARVMLCNFRDVRASEYFIDERLNFIKDIKFADYYLTKCVDKFIKAGLVPKESSIMQQLNLLRDEEDNLDQIQNDISAGNLELYIKAVKNAVALRDLGNRTGLNSINDRLKHSRYRIDPELILIVSSKTKTRNEFASGMAASMASADENKMAAYCQYFNMDLDTPGPKFYSEDYVKIIAKALPSLRNYNEKYPKNYLWEQSINYCVAALKSQLANEDVFKKFKNQVYPELSAEERELYDQISSGKYPKPLNQ